MVERHPYPFHIPVIPATVRSSLLIDDPSDSLRDQRADAQRIIAECYDIYRQAHDHPLVTSAMARKALAQNDHTSLNPGDNEGPDFLERMVVRTSGPIASRALCLREHKMRMALPYILDHPIDRLAMVSGAQDDIAFPYVYKDADSIMRDLERKAALREWAISEGLPKETRWEYDSVAPYWDHMNGDHDHVRALLEAEQRACQDHDFVRKVIVKNSAHGHMRLNAEYGADYFKSVYDLSMAALESGADCVKTSTGLGAREPLHHLVKKDDGAFIAKAIPMLYALRDYNAQHGTTRWPKFSGGNESEIDFAVLYHATQSICGDSVADQMVCGASGRYRDRLTKFIYQEEGPSSGIQPSDFGVYGYDIDALPAHRKGLPKPAATPENVPIPPELAKFGVVKPANDDDADGPDQGWGEQGTPQL